jgi:hypothetical protein
MIIMTIVILAAVVLGIVKGRHDFKALRVTVTGEKPGRIYFLQHQNNPDRIRIVKSKGELATPLKVVHELISPTPNAVLAQIYRDLEQSHIGGGWYDADAVRMFLDHLRGIA